MWFGDREGITKELKNSYGLYGGDDSPLKVVSETAESIRETGYFDRLVFHGGYPVRNRSKQGKWELENLHNDKIKEFRRTVYPVIEEIGFEIFDPYDECAANVTEFPWTGDDLIHWRADVEYKKATELLIRIL